jgi:hypothetical protein
VKAAIFVENLFSAFSVEARAVPLPVVSPSTFTALWRLLLAPPLPGTGPSLCCSVEGCARGEIVVVEYAVQRQTRQCFRLSGWHGSSLNVARSARRATAPQAIGEVGDPGPALPGHLKLAYLK